MADLAAQFDVNAATIRRDLNVLEAQGVVRRVHGGAVHCEREREREHEREGKEEDELEERGGKSGGADLAPTVPQARIGRAVAEMLDENETIFLGPGRLALQVARYLDQYARLTIVTNGLEVAHWVAANTPHIVIVTGGQVEERDLGLVGQLTRSALAALRADHVVVELGGVSAVDGLTDDSLPQAEIVRELLEIGSHVIVLVPVERVGRVAAAYVGPIDSADVIVTAREAPSSTLWDLTEAGVRVVLA